MIHEDDLDMLENQDDLVDETTFSAGRLLGVAFIGAFVSLGAYYIYQQLEPEKKARLKKTASGMIAEQIHTLTDVRDD